MKKVKTMFMALVMMLVTLSVPVVPLALVGCSGGCASVQEGQDIVVVRAEQTADLSFQIMDTFITFEDNNHEFLKTKAPSVVEAANKVRTEGKKAINGLRDATKAYKNNRTPENKANMQTYLALVESFRKIAADNLVTKLQ